MAYTGRKMVIIPHDALVGEDPEMLKQTEPFQTLLHDGARVGQPRSILPDGDIPSAHHADHGRLSGKTRCHCK